jgi:hypothetical protein
MTDLNALREKLRFLFTQGPTDLAIGLAIDAVVAWVNLGSIKGQSRVKAGVMTQGQPRFGQKSDPVLSVPSPDPSEAKSPKNVVELSPPGFQKFWKVFWRKVKKAKAIAAWSKLDPDPALTQVIVAAVVAQRKEQLEREPKFRPHGATWLNGREWENEADPAVAKAGDPQYRNLSAEAGLAAYCEWHRQAVNAGRPTKYPKPGCPDCKHLAAKANGRPSSGPSTLGALDEPLPDWAERNR